MATLVTGATGFTCINVVRSLAADGEFVVGVDLASPGQEVARFLQGLEDRIVLVGQDVLDTAAVEELARRYHVDRIIHGAAISPAGPDEERANPRGIVNVNLMGTVSMLEVARRIGAKRFVFISSSGLYGAPQDRAATVPEDSPLFPDDFYFICKIASELLLKYYKVLFGLSTVTGRMAAIYGPMERPTSARTGASQIYRLVWALRNGCKVGIKGSQYVRDYTHVEDAATVWKHLAFAPMLAHDIYNVSCGAAYTLRTVLETLRELDPKFSYYYTSEDEQPYLELRPGSERAALDTSRAQSEFGYVPRYDLRRGLESYLEWAEEYPAFFTPELGAFAAAAAPKVE